MLQKKLSGINRISILDQRNTNLGKYIIAEKHSLHPENVKESEKNSHLSLAQPDFYYISKIWFQDSTPTQPEIFVDDMLVHYTRTTWLSLHLYNLISWFCTCTTWNLYLYGKVTYFTMHSYTLIFFTFAKHDFLGFFILVVYMFSYIYIFRTYIYV